MFAVVVWMSHREAVHIRSRLEEVNQRIARMEGITASGRMVIHVVQGANREPVPECKVTVANPTRQKHDPFQQPDSNRVYQKEFTSNSRGEIELNPLRLGTYRAWIEFDKVPLPDGPDGNPQVNPAWKHTREIRIELSEPDQTVDADLDVTPPTFLPVEVAQPESKEWADTETLNVALSLRNRGETSFASSTYCAFNSKFPDAMPEGPWQEIQIEYAFPDTFNGRRIRDLIEYRAVIETGPDGKDVLRPTERIVRKKK